MTSQLRRADAPRVRAHPPFSATPWPGLDDQGLLARMLRRSVAHPSPQPETLATALIGRFGSLGAVVAADSPELLRVRGLDPAAIDDLKLLRELAVRLARSEAARRPVIASWTALRDYARVALAALPREQFRALFLDRRNALLRDELVADGSVDHAPVYPREVIRRALELSASALILLHNHPSGDPSPSQADIAMTRQLVEAAKVFGLRVHDHLIVGRDGTASLRALGLM